MKRVLYSIFSIFFMVSVSYGCFITASEDPSLATAGVIDFEDQTIGAYTSLAIDGVNFVAVDNHFRVTDVIGGYFNTEGLHIDNTNLGSTVIDFKFDAEVSAFGFNFGASNEDWRLDAFDASENLIEGFVLPQTGLSNDGDFFGIAANGISSARLTQLTWDYNATDWILLDNFASTPASVPEPNIMALLGIGMFFMGMIRKRK
jgi:hypothetical protein